ncbi:unnamed protein product, partial [Coccothraustes coccothraustes]
HWSALPREVLESPSLDEFNKAWPWHWRKFPGSGGTGKGEWLPFETERGQMGDWEGIPPWQCPGQAGPWGWEHPGTLGGVPAMAGLSLEKGARDGWKPWTPHKPWGSQIPLEPGQPSRLLPSL